MKRTPTLREIPTEGPRVTVVQKKDLKYITHQKSETKKVKSECKINPGNVEFRGGNHIPEESKKEIKIKLGERRVQERESEFSADHNLSIEKMTKRWSSISTNSADTHKNLPLAKKIDSKRVTNNLKK